MRKTTRKPIALGVAFALVAALGVGATLAWLTDKTDEVKNTFTVGDVDIDLYEHELDSTGKALSETETRKGESGYKLIPGTDLPKDPTVVVKGGSEACWLFVKIDESNWPAFKEADGATLKVSYEIASGWTPLDGADGVYYREALATLDGADDSYGVLDGDEVRVSDTLTKGEMDQITSPLTLSFTAYAVQKENVDSAADAWNALFPQQGA